MTSVQVDSQRFPRLAHYLSTVPGGINAYPYVETRADFSLLLRERTKDVVSDKDLPDTVRWRLDDRWKSGDWIRETTYVMLCAICRDRLWTSDKDYQKGMFDVATEMYSLPMYRAVMKVLSPSLMVFGAALRWKQFHRGVNMRVENLGRHEVSLHIDYPQRLFDELTLRSLGATFCSAVAGAGAISPVANLVSPTDTHCEFALKWAAKT